MTEKQFKENLIRMIEISYEYHKKEIADALKESRFEFEKTGDFTHHKWNYFCEYLNIYTSIDNIEVLQNYQPFILREAEKCYEPDGNYELMNVRFKPGSGEEYEDVSQEIHFEDIESKIVNEIRDAKYLIWIAMAWFTNETLYKELIAKKEQGVTVEIILDNNEINDRAAFRLEDNFPTHRISINSRYPNLMHDKFCIIDLNTVIHGSFNWTKRANYNKETISIDHNRNTAESFADEFIKLKQLAR